MLIKQQHDVKKQPNIIAALIEISHIYSKNTVLSSNFGSYLM